MKINLSKNVPQQFTQQQTIQSQCNLFNFHFNAIKVSYRKTSFPKLHPFNLHPNIISRSKSGIKLTRLNSQSQLNKNHKYQSIHYTSTNQEPETQRTRNQMNSNNKIENNNQDHKDKPVKIQSQQKQYYGSWKIPKLPVQSKPIRQINRITNQSNYLNNITQLKKYKKYQNIGQNKFIQAYKSKIKQEDKLVDVNVLDNKSYHHRQSVDNNYYNNNNQYFHQKNTHTSPVNNNLKLNISNKGIFNNNNNSNSNNNTNNSHIIKGSYQYCINNESNSIKNKYDSQFLINYSNSNTNNNNTSFYSSAKKDYTTPLHHSTSHNYTHTHIYHQNNPNINNNNTHNNNNNISIPGNSTGKTVIDDTKIKNSVQNVTSLQMAKDNLKNSNTKQTNQCIQNNQKLSKYMNSTQMSKNQQNVWTSINILHPNDTHYYINPNITNRNIQNNRLIGRSIISSRTQSKSIKLLEQPKNTYLEKPIKGLQQARQVNTVITGDVDSSHNDLSRQHSQNMLFKQLECQMNYSKILGQSTVVAKTFNNNQQGFWN